MWRAGWEKTNMMGKEITHHTRNKGKKDGGEMFAMFMLITKCLHQH